MAEESPDPRPSRQFEEVRRSGERAPVARPVANELRLEVLLNGRRLLAFACSASKLTEMVVGFLWLEGLIESPDEVDLCKVCIEDRLIEVQTSRKIDFEAYERRRALTSGCGGGTTFQDLMAARRLRRIGAGPVVEARLLFELIADLFRNSPWYRASGGLHAAALADPVAGGIQVLCEDLGRHNTIDKVAGECLLRGLDPAGGILLSTGRMSSDMVLKAGRMGIPILASRTSPTDLSLELAEQLGMTVVGYIRGDRCRVYAGGERILRPEPGVTEPGPR